MPSGSAMLAKRAVQALTPPPMPSHPPTNRNTPSERFLVTKPKACPKGVRAGRGNLILGDSLPQL